MSTQQADATVRARRGRGAGDVAIQPKSDRRELLARSLVHLTDLTVEISALAVKIMGRGGLSNVDVQVLLAIRAQPGSTPSEVAATLGLAPGAVSRSLLALRGQGVIRSRTDPADRRLTHLSVNAEGHRRLQTLVVAWSQCFAEHAGELRTLAALLDATPQKQDRKSPRDVFEALDQIARAGATYVSGVSAACERFAIGSSSDRFALTFIAFAEVSRPKDLALRLRLTTAGASAVIDRLERAGVVARRRRSERDGRATVLAVTPVGRRAAGQLLAPIEDVLADVVAALPPTTGAD